MKHRTASSSRKGQSIVEALIALGILVTGLVAIESLLARSFLLDRVTADQTKATYLASEGIEIMKSLIDNQTYNASSGGWGGFCNFAGGSQTYQVDWMTTSCPSPGGDAPLYFVSSTGLYYQGSGDGGVETPFTRIIKVTKTSGGNEIDVQSTVTWNTGIVTGQSLTLEDQFYDWQP